MIHIASDSVRTSAQVAVMWLTRQQDQSVAQVCKQIGVADQTYYRWSKEYGSLSTDQAKQLKELQRQNARLKSLLADAELDKAILREAANPNF